MNRRTKRRLLTAAALAGVLGLGWWALQAPAKPYGAPPYHLQQHKAHPRYSPPMMAEGDHYLRKVNAVPAPGTVPLVLIGLVCCAMMTRRYS